MAAIVATLMYLPVGLALGLVLRLFGVSFGAFVTFGGAFQTIPGLALWWLVSFAGACIYAAHLFPWSENVLEWPKKK